MSEKSDLVFIEHILESVDAIIEFSDGIDIGDLDSDRLRRSAIVREIEIIGEAVKNISEETKSRYGEIVWRDIVGTRNKMIHHYFGVDLGIVWRIVKHDIWVKTFLKELLLHVLGKRDGL